MKKREQKRVDYFGVLILLILLIGTVYPSGNLSANSSNPDIDSSEKSLVRGRIVEVVNGEEIAVPFATVVVLNDESRRGGISDENGLFEIILGRGDYTLRCSYMGYKSLDKSIDLGAENLNVDFSLVQDDVMLEEVKVVAKIDRESENLLLLDQKSSVVGVESIGAKELSRKGASSVASGVKKISGVSMMGSNQLFVRGLGDRYNTVILNGEPVSSPDPTKKVIGLDIFPSDIVKYLGVNKVFSVRNYSDYTGALIEINTKEYLNNSFANLKFDLNYSVNSTGKNFRKIDAEGARYFGFDIGARRELTPDIYLTENRTQDIGSDFNIASYGFSEEIAMPNISVGLSGGHSFDLEGDKSIGLLFNLSFNNSNEILAGVKEKSVNRQNSTASSFVTDVYNYRSSLGALLGLSFISDADNSIRYNLLYQRDGADQFKEKSGYVNDWPDADESLVRVSEYISFSLFNNQLRGKHTLSGGLREIDWGLTYSESRYDVPDRREIVYQRSGDRWSYLTLNNGNDTKRVLIDQFNREMSFSFNVVNQLKGSRGEFAYGVEGKGISQEYNSYLYGYLFDLESVTSEDFSIDIDAPNESLTSSTVEAINNNSSDNMGYRGEQWTYGGYFDLVYNINPKTILNAGVRAEYSNMDVTENTLIEDDGNENVEGFSNVDIFPAITVKRELSDKESIRFSATRTVVRPSFYEKTPARLIPEAGEYSSYGNPYSRDNPNPADGSFLENSYSINIDVRYELYPKLGELVAISAYYKRITDPIESVTRLQGGSDYIYTFMNLDESANAGGIEFEIKKRFNQIYAGLNASYIYTNLKVPEGRNENEEYRQLQGASPYIVNADFGYNFIKKEGRKLYGGLSYNVFGKRITSVGVSGAGNQYQLPQHSLDLIVDATVSDRLSLGFKAKNILNASTEHIQDVYSLDDIESSTTIMKSYKGLGFSLGCKYKL